MRGLIGSCLRQLRSNRRLGALVATAALGTLIIFALHIAHVIAGSQFDFGQVLFNAGLKAKRFSITFDRGYGECFEYLMLAIIVIGLARLAFTTRQPIYFALLFIFIYYLADNSLMIHENLGVSLVHWLDLQPAFGLRARDFGELGTWALFGVPLLGYLCFALWRSDGSHKVVGLTLTGSFFVLAFFGGVIDMVQVLARGHGIWTRLVSFVEDGGEMAVVVVIVALTLSVPAYLREEGVADEKPP